MKRILFICTGNICRSPMAEALLRHMLQKAGLDGFEVFSRGVAADDGRLMSPEAREALRAEGIDGSQHRAASLTMADLERADLIFVMEERHWDIVKSQFSANYVRKTHLLKEYAGDGAPGDRDIADPYGGSPADYEACKREIQDSLLGLFAKLKEPGNSL